MPLLFLANNITGLGSTQKLNLPMFTVLRRFSIVMIMVAEYYVLRKESSGELLSLLVVVVVVGLDVFVVETVWRTALMRTTAARVKFSVFLLILGAVVAAASDFRVDLYGYTLIMANNLATALQGVVLRKKLDSKDLGTFGTLFYNSLAAIPISLAIMLLTESSTTLWSSLYFPKFSDSTFLAMFLASASMGCLLNLSTYICTKVNSPLTTAIVGCLKNIVTTYAGMIVGGDYVFNNTNFLGLNISVSGSLYYTYVKYTEERKPAAPPLPAPATIPSNSAGTSPATATMSKALPS
jgi:solute carrier family 35